VVSVECATAYSTIGPFNPRSPMNIEETVQADNPANLTVSRSPRWGLRFLYRNLEAGGITLKSRLINVDSIYLAVNNRVKSMEWFKKNFGLIQDDENRLKIGNVEVFFLESLDGSTTNILTKDWVKGDDHFPMPAFCFLADDIKTLYTDLKTNEVRTEEIQDHGWFLEFDFYDPDNNKFKVWEPKANNQK
jgi:hypothetical protein